MGGGRKNNMSKKREKAEEKRAEKRSIYDNVAISERTLSILIVFGIIAAALAITCGYFMGNRGQIDYREYNGMSVAEIQKASPDGEAFCV